MEIKKLLKWRNVWMGIAMLWMVWYHSGLEVQTNILFNLKCWGYGGVDIFLFASGLGCYYSLDKNSDFAEFIKRRVIRIIPTYWLFLVIWIIYRFMTTGFPRRAVIGNFLCIQTFTALGNDFNWYISAMWLLYFLAPFFHSTLKKYTNWKPYVAMLCMLLLITIPFWGSSTYIIMVTRIPIFFLGMVLAKLAKEDKLIKPIHITTLVVLMCIGFAMLYYFCMGYQHMLWSHGLYWYPFILIVPGFCVVISCIMEKIANTIVGKWVEKGLSLLGSYSFEIYLVHAFMYDIYRNFFIATDAKYNQNDYWYIVILLVIPGCWLFIKLNKLLHRLLANINLCN